MRYGNWILRQRQLGRGGQRFEAAQPVLFRAPVALGVALLRGGQHVVAEADLERCEVSNPLIGELDQFSMQDLQAPDVDKQQITTEVE